MRRLVVLDLFSGPAWRDASEMDGHVHPGEAGGWLLIQPDAVRVTGGHAEVPVLRDPEHGGPSFSCRVVRTTSGTDRPTVHTVATGDADLYEEVLISVGFHLEQPEGIELQRDESGTYWGYYV